MSVESLRRVIRSNEIRKAFSPEAMDLITALATSEEAHGRNLELLRDALAEHTGHQLRLSGSFWARLKWLAVGR